MDLTDIYAWTRERLETEARKRGIDDYRSLTRQQLIARLLAAGWSAGANAMRRAGGVLNAALSAAAIRLPRRLEALRNLSRRLPAATRLWPETAKTAAPSFSGPRRVSFSPAAANIEISESATQKFRAEPIRTRSMAQLLATHGYTDRAHAIYQELLERLPSDESLRREAEAFSRGEPVKLEYADQIARAGQAETIAPPKTEDEIRCEGDIASGLTVNWKITEPGIRRAAAVLGCEGDLAIRIMAVIPDAEQVVRSEIIEHGPVESSGSWKGPSIPSGSRCFTAIGLRAKNRFVAIVHAPTQSA